MRYVIKQIVAATVFLISFIALREHDSVNTWLFHGLGEWFCIIIPLGVILISSKQLCQDGPKKVVVEDWRKNFKQTFSSKYDLTSQRAQREQSETPRKKISDDWRSKKTTIIDV